MSVDPIINSEFSVTLNDWFADPNENKFTNSAANPYYGTIENWDVSQVTNMDNAFNPFQGNAPSSFNDNIGGWNTSSVTSMVSMFDQATSFNNNNSSSIGDWAVSNCTDMISMFRVASAFNQDISFWSVASVTSMTSMFDQANSFNQPIGSWNVSSVTTMDNMFLQATSFNGNIGSWSTGNLENSRYMFASATNFNQDISSWNVSSITDMGSMFSSAAAFNQDISVWNVNTSSPPTLTNMFTNSGMVGNAFGLSTPTPLVSEFNYSPTPPTPPTPSNPDLTPCFLHDTLISTTRGLVKVQDLQYGDLVETYDHGAVPLTYLGVKVISHMAKDTRDPNQLYVCSKDHFPSAINDLVMTGCHSIFLFRGFKDEQEKRDVCAINGDVYVTDRQLRFPICALRDSVKVYPEKGTFNIYHFSLAHNDEFMNYMVYANNLPVETASNSYMVYCSGMKLIGNTSPVRKTIHNDEPVTKHTKLVDDNFTLA